MNFRKRIDHRRDHGLKGLACVAKTPANPVGGVLLDLIKMALSEGTEVGPRAAGAKILRESSYPSGHQKRCRAPTSFRRVAKLRSLAKID